MGILFLWVIVGGGNSGSCALQMYALSYQPYSKKYQAECFLSARIINVRITNINININTIKTITRPVISYFI